MKRERANIVSRVIFRSVAAAGLVLYYTALVHSLIEGLRVVPVLLYRYGMKISLLKARSPGARDYGGGQIRLGTRTPEK